MKKKIIKKILKPITKKIEIVEPDERQQEILRAKEWLDKPSEPEVDERQEEIKRVKRFFNKG